MYSIYVILARAKWDTDRVGMFEEELHIVLIYIVPQCLSVY